VVRIADGLTARHLQVAGHAISQAVADHAIAHLGLDPDRVTVIFRGRGRERLGHPGGQRRSRAREARGLADGDVLAVTLGRQEPVKGHVTLVDAWKEVAARHPRAQLVIAGREGRATRDVHAAVARLPSAAGDRVSLPGAVTDVGELLSAADLFVLPSSVEGLSGALVEALAMGLPVVATDLPPVREVVPSDRHAVLVPFGDAVALADAISVLLADRERRRAMGAANLHRFEDRFTLDRSLDGMEAFYASVLSRSGSRAAEAVVHGLVEPAEQEPEPVERRRGVDSDP
jgi:glycosyltransferase involved in cell wall biosynthesis